MVHVSNVPAGRTDSRTQAFAEATNARERMKDKAAAFIEDLQIGNEEAMLVSELKGPMPAKAAIPLFGPAFCCRKRSALRPAGRDTYISNSGRQQFPGMVRGRPCLDSDVPSNKPCAKQKPFPLPVLSQAAETYPNS